MKMYDMAHATPSPLDIAVFGVGSYVAFAVFVIGVIWRIYSWARATGLTGLYSVAIPGYMFSTSANLGEVLKRIFILYTLNYSDKAVLIGSFLFHWGIWIALLGHLSMIFPPERFGMPKEVHEAIAHYVGGAAGVIALLGLIILLIRRLTRNDVRRISYLDDWFALTILLIITALGVVNTLVVEPEYMETVSPWLQGFFMLKPDLAAIAAAEPTVKAHVFFALIFIAYVPFGKLIHPFSFLLMPTLWNKATKLYGYVFARLR